MIDCGCDKFAEIGLKKYKHELKIPKEKLVEIVKYPITSIMNLLYITRH
jgi:hypothetical protein